MDKLAILDKLNNRRNKVAAGELRSLPSAENMMKLIWNEELEASAQRWANQCIKHSSPDIKDICRDLGSLYVEQNIATVYGEAPGLTPLALVDMWYMQLLNINASVIPRYQRSMDAVYSSYEYFTQLVWANSWQVGCAGVKFKERVQDSNNGKKRTIYRLVCNFAPGGNVAGEVVYAAGAPCSRCPHRTCDAHYLALCSPISTETKQETFTESEDEQTTSTVTSSIKHVKLTKPKSETKIKANLEGPEVATIKSGEEELRPYDYFSHLHDYVRPTLATTIKKTTSCKDNILAVDEFVELLKKKLGTDPMFKDFIQTTAMSPGNIDNSYTDAMALLSRIYSTKAPSTTPTFADSEYLNSTLLVDLVEAVIFRSGDKMKVTQEGIRVTQPQLNVSPVKIQAELAEVRRNSEFTGHLFFPEDIENDDTITEPTESYYDAANPATADFQLQAIKKMKVTKDFLDEILESETVPESTTKLTLLSPDYVNLYKSGQSSMKKFLEEIGVPAENNVVINKRDVSKELKLNNDPDSSSEIDYYDNVRQDYISDDSRTPLKSFKKNMDHDCGINSEKYSDLLRKLAADLKPLRLNKLFHCTENQAEAQKHANSKTYCISTLGCLILFAYFL